MPEPFTGHSGTAHRTTGERAWCLGCGEWCWREDACACCEVPMLIADNERLTGERDKLAAAVERVRTMHQPKTITRVKSCRQHKIGRPDVQASLACEDCPKIPILVCTHCSCPNDSWPCPTITALDQQENAE